MCQYCENGNGKEFKLYSNLPIQDDFDKEYIENNQLQYIRQDKQKYFLVTETNNEDGDVLILEINYCPMCGRKLGEVKENDNIR